MRVSKSVASKAIFAIALACLANFAPAQHVQQSDQVIAERVLGPQWKQLSRQAGMIFAGTVLGSMTQTVPSQNMTTQAVTAQTAATDRPTSGTPPAVQLSFRVDHAIAGVESGQTLTIHEWAGASSMQRPMIKGQHILLFLYPPSRLGLTSPVCGSLGQIALDSNGKNVSEYAQKPAAANGSQSEPSLRPPTTVITHSVTVLQLERAIRSARIGEE
jgi:hypothetical protein